MGSAARHFDTALRSLARTRAPDHVTARFLTELENLREAVDALIGATRANGYDPESSAYQTYLDADYAVNEITAVHDAARALDDNDPDAALYAEADHRYDLVRDAEMIS